MKRLGMLLGMICLGLFLVAACGQQKEPEKAQKSSAPTATAPAKQAAPTPKQETTPATPQATPTKPSPEKK
jgi:hypothetical protein